MPDNGRNNILLTVYNSQMTKADGDADTAYERQLNRLDCFFYVRGRTDQPCVYYQMVEVDDVGQSTVAFYVNDLVLKEIFRQVRCVMCLLSPTTQEHRHLRPNRLVQISKALDDMFLI